MKNKLSVGIFWLLAFAFLLNSCRQDLLPDEEQTYNNSSQFRLTSKRISLKESRHKDKIAPILKKTTSELRKVKNISAFGRMVSYGNGVSIDTDDVIYVENGNYHNYVFRINKENKAEGDPIDNLLLSPLPDGSYQEFLVQYHISEQELELFGKGNYTIPKEKIKVTELASGTYNNGQLIQSRAQVCDYLTVLAGYTPCGANKHFSGEGGDVCNEAKVGNGSKPIYVTFRSCTDIETGLPPGWEYGGGGNPSEGGGGSVCTDCPPETNIPCVELPTNPMDPSFGVGGNGCNLGLPVLPNIEILDKNKPCDNIKLQFAKTKYKAKKDSINKTSFFKKPDETGFSENKNGSLTDLQVNPPTSNSQGLHVPITINTLGYTHTHLDDVYTGKIDPSGMEEVRKKTRMFSPADVNTLMQIIDMNRASGDFKDYYATMLSSDGTYVIKFDGTVNDIKTTFGTDEWRDKYIEYFKENNKRTNETNFLLFLKNRMQVNGVSLYKVNANGKVFEIKMNNAGTRAESKECGN